MKSLSRGQLFATPWTVAQAPPSMEFSRQEYWSGLPFSSPGDLPNPGIEPSSPALQTDALPSEPPAKPKVLEGVLKARSGLGRSTKSKIWSQPSGEAAAAKSLQSCPTLCNPIESSPSGSPVSGILQVRTLEWVAISFSSAEETWKYQYDCSATIKYRQNAQDEPGEGPSYCVGATGSASQIGWYELGLQGGLEFYQVGREGKWSSTQKEEHLQSQWGGYAWLAQAGWESQLAAAQGIWVGAQETGQRVWAPQKISPVLMHFPLQPALGSSAFCHYGHQRAGKERKPAHCSLCFPRA